MSSRTSSSTSCPTFSLPSFLLSRFAAARTTRSTAAAAAAAAAATAAAAAAAAAATTAGQANQQKRHSHKHQTHDRPMHLSSATAHSSSPPTMDVIARATKQQSTAGQLAERVVAHQPQCGSVGQSGQAQGRAREARRGWTCPTRPFRRRPR